MIFKAHASWIILETRIRTSPALNHLLWAMFFQKFSGIYCMYFHEYLYIFNVMSRSIWHCRAPLWLRVFVYMNTEYNHNRIQIPLIQTFRVIQPNVLLRFGKISVVVFPILNNS